MSDFILPLSLVVYNRVKLEFQSVLLDICDYVLFYKRRGFWLFGLSLVFDLSKFVVVELLVLFTVTSTLSLNKSYSFFLSFWVDMDRGR